MREVVVLDFETTGLSPYDARIIEVGAVLLKGGKITKRFSQLMDPGYEIPYFITSLTGITDEMLEGKPSPEQVMPELAEFVGDRPIVAHNASFDRKFYQGEMRRVGFDASNSFLCTLMLSRRLIPGSINHKLGTLAHLLGFEYGKDAHRALADAEVTAHLWNYLYQRICDRTGRTLPDIEIFEKISKKPKASVDRFIESLR